MAGPTASPSFWSNAISRLRGMVPDIDLDRVVRVLAAGAPGTSAFPDPRFMSSARPAPLREQARQGVTAVEHGANEYLANRLPQVAGALAAFGSMGPDGQIFGNVMPNENYVSARDMMRQKLVDDERAYPNAAAIGRDLGTLAGEYSHPAYSIVKGLINAYDKGDSDMDSASRMLLSVPNSIAMDKVGNRARDVLKGSIGKQLGTSRLARGASDVVARSAVAKLKQLEETGVDAYHDFMSFDAGQEPAAPSPKGALSGVRGGKPSAASNPPAGSRPSAPLRRPTAAASPLRAEQRSAANDPIDVQALLQSIGGLGGPAPSAQLAGAPLALAPQKAKSPLANLRWPPLFDL